MGHRKQGTQPTIKEKIFVASFIKENFNASKAALQVYNTTKKNSKMLGYQVLNRPEVQNELHRQLEEAGLSLDTVNNMMAQAITFNLNYGKPSQAVAASLIKHAHKLYNAIPSSKSSSVKVSLSGKLTANNVDEVIATLTKLSSKSADLVADIS